MPSYDSKMYDDGPDISMGGTMDSTKGKEHEEGSEESEGPEAVLPKEILMGKEFDVGDSVVLRITRIGDKDISVKYDTEGTKDEHSEQGGSHEGDAEMPQSNPGSGYY